MCVSILSYLSFIYFLSTYHLCLYLSSYIIFLNVSVCDIKIVCLRHFEISLLYEMIHGSGSTLGSKQRGAPRPQEGAALKAGQGCHKPQQRQTESFRQVTPIWGTEGIQGGLSYFSLVTKMLMWQTASLVPTRNFQTDQVRLRSWQRLWLKSIRYHIVLWWCRLSPRDSILDLLQLFNTKYIYKISLFSGIFILIYSWEYLANF